MLKTISFRIRMTPQDRVQWGLRAMLAGKSLSEWLRDLARADVARAAYPLDRSDPNAPMPGREG